MTWNYRVVRKNGLLGIHEAYYDESGTVHSLSVDSVSPVHDNLSELKTDLELMLGALDDGIVEYDDCESRARIPELRGFEIENTMDPEAQKLWFDFDVIAEIEFFSSSDGGRSGPTPAESLHCIFELDGEFFDCRLLLESIGTSGTIPIKFLFPELVKPRLMVGTEFYLKEIGRIARGTISEVN